MNSQVQVFSNRLHHLPSPRRVAAEDMCELDVANRSCEGSGPPFARVAERESRERGIDLSMSNEIDNSGVVALKVLADTTVRRN